MTEQSNWLLCQDGASTRLSPSPDKLLLDPIVKCIELLTNLVCIETVVAQLAR